MLCCSSVAGEHLVGQEVAASPFHSEVEGAATTQRAGPAAAVPYLESGVTAGTHFQWIEFNSYVRTSNPVIFKVRG